MRHLLAVRLLPGLLGAVAGCGGGGLSPGRDGGAPADLAAAARDLALPPRPPLGAPIAAPMNQWSWVDIPGSRCDDGSPTGIAINPGSSKKLLLFLNGGGACWDYTTCFVANTASHGPIGRAQFNAAGLAAPGSIFDRSVADNVFRDFSLVLVPYCTGDLHIGDRVAMYQGGGGTRTYHHKGRVNLEAMLPRVAGTWPEPEQIVVSGGSAGGFGSVLNYELFRRYFPRAKAALLDDSGPPLIGDDIPAGFRESWFQAWGVENTVGPFCPDCKNDLSLVVTRLAEQFPADRLALISSLRDQVISGYIFTSPAGYETAITDLATKVFDVTPRAGYFLVAGNEHVFVGKPGSTVTGGVRLTDWIRRLVSDDPAWRSVRP